MGGAANTYDTKLTPDQEKGFQAWKAKVAPHDSGVDFDWRGAYLADLKPDSRGHYFDTYKKPNHPTFSTGSIYSTPEHPGGVWAPDASGKMTYTPSQWMMKDQSRMADLQKYMVAKEPESALILPNMGGSNTQQPSMMQKVGNYVSQHDYHPNLHQGEYPTEQEMNRSQVAQPSAQDVAADAKRQGNWEKYIRDFQKSQYQQAQQNATNSDQRVY